MRESFRYVKERLVLGVELQSEPLSKSGRAQTKVDCDIQNPPYRAAHQLRHRLLHVLVVHAAEHSLAGRRMGVLHEV